MKLDFQKKARIIDRIATIFAALFVVATLVMPGSMASAGEYESWIRGTTQHPGSSTTTTTISGGAVETDTEADAAAEDAEPNTITKILAEGVGYIGTALRKGFQGNGAIDASVTGIIMGHIVNGKSYFVFDLTDNNKWGVVGATLYVALRAIMIVMLFVAVSAQVIAPMWKGDSRGGALVKNALLTFVAGIFIITVMPLIVDWVCTVRDELGVVLYNSVKGVLPTGKTISYTNPITGVTHTSKVDQSLGNTIEGMYYNLYTSQPNIVNALLYLIVCCLPLAFIFSYIKLAVIQTVMFGLFPLFAFVGTMDKGETIKKWLITFVTNAMVPCLDMTLIFLPSLLLSSIMDDGTVESTNLIIMIILVIILFGIVPVRNMILGIFGNGGNWGLEKGSTLGGMLAAAAGAVAGAALKGKEMFDNYREQTQGASKEDMKDAAEADKNLSDTLDSRASADVEKDSDKDKAGSEPDGDKSRDMESGGGESKDGSGESGDGGENGDGTHQATANNEITSEDTADIERLQANNEASANAEANVDVDGGDKETNVENNTYGNLGETSGSSEGAKSAEQLIDDLSVSREDMEKAASEGNNGLAQSINENSYRDTVGKTKIDHSKFNMSRAANLQSMENMNGAIKDIDKKTAELNKDTAKQQGVMNKERQALNELYKANGVRRDENGNFDKKDIEAKRAMMPETFAKAADAHIEKLNDARDKIDANKAQIATNNANKSVLQGEVGRRQDIEKTYAGRYAETGRSGQTFSSVEDFSNQLKKEERARNIVNFSNYKDKQFEGVLSDAQRIQYQREAAKREARGKLMSGVATAGAAAAITPLALASGSAQGAAQFYRQSSKIGNAVGTGAVATANIARAGTSRAVSAAANVHSSMDSNAMNYMARELQRQTPKYQKAKVINGSVPADSTPPQPNPQPQDHGTKPTKANRVDTGVDTATSSYDTRPSNYENSGARVEQSLNRPEKPVNSQGSNAQSGG